MAKIYYLIEEDENGNIETLYRCIETDDIFSTAYLVNDKWKYDATFYKVLDNLHEGRYFHISDKEAAEIALMSRGKVDLMKTDEEYANKLIDEESRYNVVTESEMSREEADANRKRVKAFYELRREQAKSIPTPIGIEKLVV